MQAACRLAAAYGNLGHLCGQPVGGQGGNTLLQGFQRNGGDAEPGLRVGGQGGIHNGLQIALAAADENSVRRRQILQRFRGFALDQR